MLLLKLIAFSISVMFTAWLLPGISVEGFWVAVPVSIVLGLINVFIKPLLMFIVLPLNIITIGFFSLFINAFLLWLAGYITPGFAVNGFWSAFLGAIILSLINTLINSIKFSQNKN